MKYNVQALPNFKREAKRLLKKYPSLKNELELLSGTLQAKPDFGTPIGKDCYKIRISIASKAKGKSGGARIITHVYVAGATVFLFSIYDKSEQENVSTQQVAEWIKSIGHTE
jgi:mRNA-degrading endonuclease RelE of RelBE toxin-antitoxin system